MAGTKEGGRRAAETNKKLHGDDFYKRIGSLGGQNGHTGGFASNPALARIAGAKGGRKSRRGRAGLNKEKEYYYSGDPKDVGENPERPVRSWEKVKAKYE